ncbi:hypothetical protein [Azorhizobium doebereinerae]|nr:hypothetical protein [Azorhizobium doebereinerae]
MKHFDDSDAIGAMLIFGRQFGRAEIAVSHPDSRPIASFSPS